MNRKQEAELRFWKNLWDSGTYQDVRDRNLKEKTKLIPDVIDEEGYGIDLGCGLTSIFEGSGLQVIGVDPLVPEFQKITKGDLPYFADTKEFDSRSIDYVACINVLDHTPEPEELLEEVYRILKPGGRLYIEVNFDDELWEACHYSLFTVERIHSLLAFFLLEYEKTLRRDAERQTQYWAKYFKPHIGGLVK